MDKKAGAAGLNGVHPCRNKSPESPHWWIILNIADLERKRLDEEKKRSMGTTTRDIWSGNIRRLLADPPAITEISLVETAHHIAAAMPGVFTDWNLAMDFAKCIESGKRL